MARFSDDSVRESPLFKATLNCLACGTYDLTVTPIADSTGGVRRFCKCRRCGAERWIAEVDGGAENSGGSHGRNGFQGGM